MGWDPGIELRDDRPYYRVSASDAEQVAVDVHCPLRLALKVRPATFPETGDWQQRRAPFMLNPFIDAAKRIERSAAIGVAVPEAIAQQKPFLRALHGGVSNYLEHALECYFEYHEAREDQLGKLTLLGDWLVVEKKPGSHIAAWALLYESATGDREIRRLRLGSVRDEVTDWVSFAAHIAAEAQGTQPVERVWVTEVSLSTGLERHLLEGVTPERAEHLYETLGRSAAILATMGTTARPGRDCADCKYTSRCDKLIPAAGVLQVPKVGPWTRSVSASDLELYARCPSRWYMQKEVHLPGEYDGGEALFRGKAVHSWLAAAHKRGVPCTAADLPAPSATSLSVFDAPGDHDDYAMAYPFLRSHLSSCPLRSSDLEVEAIEESLYGYDAAADVVTVTKVDGLWRHRGTLVIHEVKTTQEKSSLSADAIFDSYLAVAWGLVTLENGLIERFKTSRGEVHLEILSPVSSESFVYRTDDLPLMRMARGRVRRLAEQWLHDTEWRSDPGPHCASCPVRRWCPDSDEWRRGRANEASATGPIGQG